MKFLKKAFCLVMVLAMTISIMALPASASENDDFFGAIYNEFSSFPVLRRNSSNTEYVKLLQRFLYVLPATREMIYNTDNTYHGIDGGFGWVTEEAVLYFQTATFGQSGADGIVGINTWRAILAWLNRLPGENPGDYVYIFDMDPAGYSRSVMMYPKPNNNRYDLYTFRANDTNFPNSFHSFTYPS